MKKVPNKFTAQQVVDAIKKHKMDISYYPDSGRPWTAACTGGGEGEASTLERAVQKAAETQEEQDAAARDEEERRDQAEYARLSRKYGTAV